MRKWAIPAIKWQINPINCISNAKLPIVSGESLFFCWSSNCFPNSSHAQHILFLSGQLQISMTASSWISFWFITWNIQQISVRFSDLITFQICFMQRGGKNTETIRESIVNVSKSYVIKIFDNQQFAIFKFAQVLKR